MAMLQTAPLLKDLHVYGLFILFDLLRRVFHCVPVSKIGTQLCDQDACDVAMPQTAPLSKDLHVSRLFIPSLALSSPERSFVSKTGTRLRDQEVCDVAMPRTAPVPQDLHVSCLFTLFNLLWQVLHCHHLYVHSFPKQVHSSVIKMPVMWQCPGQPQCRKIYLYARGLKAHIPSCKHAQKRRVTYSEALNTMLTIVQHAENTQRGNITVSRDGKAVYLQPKPTLDRI